MTSAFVRSILTLALVAGAVSSALAASDPTDPPKKPDTKPMVTPTLTETSMANTPMGMLIWLAKSVRVKISRPKPSVPMR